MNAHLAEPEDDEVMPDYILRYKPDLDHEPWLAIYPEGAVRYIGGNEAGHDLTLLAPDDLAGRAPCVSLVRRRAAAVCDAGHRARYHVHRGACGDLLRACEQAPRQRAPGATASSS